MLRIAAIADTHVAEDSSGRLRPHWQQLHEVADVLLLGGDLTNLGNAQQAAALTHELEGIDIPMVAVLGNHDYHAGEPDTVRRALEQARAPSLKAKPPRSRSTAKRSASPGRKGSAAALRGRAATRS